MEAIAPASERSRALWAKSAAWKIFGTDDKDRLDPPERWRLLQLQRLPPPAHITETLRRWNTSRANSRVSKASVQLKTAWQNEPTGGFNLPSRLRD